MTTTTSSSAHLDPNVRHDMVFLFDVVDGNPNGDPDAGNRPRMDEESGQGLVTDVALKRKIRDTINLAAGGDPRYEVFVQAGYALNPRLEESYTQQGLTPGKKTKVTADRVTDRWKMAFGARFDEQREAFDIDDGGELEVRRTERTAEWFVARGLGPHWSFGLDGAVASSTFGNISLAARSSAAAKPHGQSFPWTTSGCQSRDLSKASAAREKKAKRM